MQFLSIRCLNCSNVDEYPRIGHDDIPYCSQCSATSNLVPEASVVDVPKTPEQNDTDMDIDLAAMFNRHLNLTYPSTPPQQAAAATPLHQTTPITPPPNSPTVNDYKYSISQHYHHSAHLVRPPSPQTSEPACDLDPVSAQLFSEHSAAEKSRRSDREYAEYLMSSDLSSPTSLNELQIAVAHGIISSQEYSSAIDALTHKAQLAQNAERHAKMMGQHTALLENCSAMDMINAANKSNENRDNEWNSGNRGSEWNNDYYGGISTMEDEYSPCSIGAWESAGGCRLAPFNY